MKTLQSSFILESSDVAKFRLHAINHHRKFGLRSTLDAFRVKKSTFYDWKRAYDQSGRRLVSLVPKKTRPHRLRTMQTDWRLVEFIRQMRHEYGNVGKNIIKPFLDAYAQELGISSLGLTTIGKIIDRRGFTFETRTRARRKTKFTKLRTRKSPRVTKPGFIQMDSIIVYVNKERHLFMSVMDIHTKYALVELVTSLSAVNATTVFKKFQKLSPTPVQIVQTDNGSEFLASFHDYLESRRIRHQFIYPRLVKVNSFIERFNRTVQEEFINRSDEIYYDLEAFGVKLEKYLYWYNYKRPHASLNYLSPVAFIKAESPKGG